MHHGFMSQESAKFAHPLWARQRELGQRIYLGHSDVFLKSLYSSIKPCFWWDGGKKSRNGHSGILSLEFSPNGSLLVAGCENSSFHMFDPLSRKLFHTVQNAHASLITNVKFLDSRLFALGGVDRTISLWDARNLKSRYGILRGHTNAIKNIEFSPKNNLLITSALDGIFCTWDMKNSAETEECCRKIFRSGLHFGLRITPDESKMIFSSLMGYLIIVHDLDLNKIDEVAGELQMAMLGRFLREAATPPARHAGACLSPRRHRNRVEVVEDFPSGACHNVISSLEAHPQGESVVSRCTCVKNNLQWICVHDIREEPAAEGRAWPAGAAGGAAVHLCRDRHESHGGSASSSTGSSTRSGDTSGTENFLSNTDESSGGDCGDRVAQQVPPEVASSLKAGNWRERPCTRTLNHSVDVPTPRMTHYFMEPVINKSRFEILSLSSDGRLICSLIDCGIRLLSFSPEVSEQPVSCAGREPIRLHELKTYISHKSTVRSARFSPRHCLLVSGCLSGKLAWHQPVV